MSFSSVDRPIGFDSQFVTEFCDEKALVKVYNFIPQQRATRNVCLFARLVQTRTFTSSSIHISTVSVLHPYWITGFIDAEGCFYIGFSKNIKRNIGWSVIPTFNISLHEKDRALLELIQSSLGGVGKIYKHGQKSIQYQVSSVRDLRVIIKHLDKHPLISQKRLDFELFKESVELINRKEHLTFAGLNALLAIKRITGFQIC